MPATQNRWAVIIGIDKYPLFAPHGQLEGCVIAREFPPGSRLGRAALELAPYFRWRPPTQDGRPLDNSEITVGVEFPP